MQPDSHSTTQGTSALPGIAQPRQPGAAAIPLPGQGLPAAGWLPNGAYPGIYPPGYANGSVPAAETPTLEYRPGMVLPMGRVATAAPVAYTVMTRLLDIVLGLAGLLVTLPVMLVIAAIIRADSPGPAVFRQVRVGEGGRLFRFYKFRTMWADARERFPELYAYRYSEDEVRCMHFKHDDDPRLTRFGAWLRRTSLDELLNLINVLKGDMTLVGPRPEIPELVPYYWEDQLEKFLVKPGVTGLAQITGRGRLSFQETIASDLAYCARRSLRLDLKIIFTTTKKVFVQDGAF